MRNVGVHTEIPEWSKVMSGSIFEQHLGLIAPQVDFIVLNGPLRYLLDNTI